MMVKRCLFVNSQKTTNSKKQEERKQNVQIFLTTKGVSVGSFQATQRSNGSTCPGLHHVRTLFLRGFL